MKRKVHRDMVKGLTKAPEGGGMFQPGSKGRDCHARVDERGAMGSHHGIPGASLMCGGMKGGG